MVPLSLSQQRDTLLIGFGLFLNFSTLFLLRSTTFNEPIDSGGTFYLPMVGRTQEFPDGGANPKGGRANLLFGQIFTKNCIKMKEI